MIPRYLGPTTPITDLSGLETNPADLGGGAWAAHVRAYGSRSKRPSLPGNLETLEPEDLRLLEVSEDVETQSETGAGFLSSRYYENLNNAKSFK